MKTTERFWELSRKTMLHLSVVVLKLSGEPVSKAGIERIIRSMPRDEEQVHDGNWQSSSYLVTVMDLIEAKYQAGEMCKREEAAYNAAGEFFFREVPAMHSRTRECIVRTLLDPDLPSDLKLEGEADA